MWILLLSVSSWRVICVSLCAQSLTISGMHRTLTLSMGFIEGKLCTKCHALDFIEEATFMQWVVVVVVGIL